MGSEWDIVGTVVVRVVEVVASIALGVAAFLVWRIHKTNQKVHLHDIGKLSKKEERLLDNKVVGSAWFVMEGEYVRGIPMHYINYPNVRYPSCIFPVDNNGNRIDVTIENYGKEKRITTKVPCGDSVLVLEYIDAMNKLVLYGLMDKEKMAIGYSIGEGDKFATDVYIKSDYGEQAYIRNSVQSQSLIMRLIHRMFDLFTFWT